MNDKRLRGYQNRLIEQGVDITSAEYREAEARAVQNTILAIERPEMTDVELPEWYHRRARDWSAFGRIGVLMQVMFIQGGLAPIMNVLLIAVDTYRVFGVVNTFEPGWLAAILLALATLASYTYISLLKADLKYALRGNVRHRFSLVGVGRWLAYVVGGRNWQPRVLTQTELDYRRVRSFHSMFKLGIFIMLVLHSIVGVVNGTMQPTLLGSAQANPATVLNAVSGAVGGIIVTVILIIALDMQIERSYRLYMETGGAAAMSQNFFAAQLERYYDQIAVAEKEARMNFAMFKLAETLEQTRSSSEELQS